MSKLVLYSTELDENKHNVLVQERVVCYGTSRFDSPGDVTRMMNTLFHLDKKAEEYAYILAMNVKCRVTGIFMVSHGTYNLSLVSPREVFIRLVLCGACGFVLVHNHPSGDPEPSKPDLDVTRKLMLCGEMFGIELIDHIIIGDGKYLSLKEIGKLTEGNEDVA